MLVNRYDDKLREGNHMILALIPGNIVLRVALSFEIKKIFQKQQDIKILEIGVGEGDLTAYILRYNPTLTISCLDISQEMIDSSKKLLAAYLDRIRFIQADAVDYLKDCPVTYDLIVSAWTIHNFSWEDKISFLKATFSSLHVWGSFLLMDKIYPDSCEVSHELLHTQINRFKYLPTALAEEIISHEHQDFLDTYRMDVSATIDILKDIGFQNIELLDRVERDVLLIAKK